MLGAGVAFVLDQCFIVMPQLVDILSGPFVLSESTCPSTFISLCFQAARIAHITSSTPFRYLAAFFSLFQLPFVGFAIFVHLFFAAYCTSALSKPTHFPEFTPLRCGSPVSESFAIYRARRK